MVELFKELRKTYMQVTVSVCFLIMQLEIVTYIVLAFWAFKLALHFLRKDAESRCPW